MSNVNCDNCDKCGKRVAKGNSALWLEFQVTGENALSFTGQERHLYPEGDCEGSPSRVHLINSNQKWADAYQALQQAEE
jgi:hypothetical protein